MIRTRTPYQGGGIVFKFKAAIVTTMRQVQEMMTTSMISEGEDIVLKMDAVYRETGLPGSHNGQGSSAMLHHECRHMAAHLGNAGEKSSTTEDRPETAALRQVDRFTHEGRTPEEDVSSHSMKHEHRDDGQQGADGQAIGLMRIEYTAYATP